MAETTIPHQSNLQTLKTSYRNTKSYNYHKRVKNNLNRKKIDCNVSDM